jgi:hypothetical protein
MGEGEASKSASKEALIRIPATETSNNKNPYTQDQTARVKYLASQTQAGGSHTSPPL